MTWIVGQPMTVSTRIFLDGVEVTTGTATVRYWRNNAGTIEYLQADGTSWSATPATFAAAHVAGVGFCRLVTNAPASADGYQVRWDMTHSVHGTVDDGAENVVQAGTQEPDLEIIPD